MLYQLSYASIWFLLLEKEIGESLCMGCCRQDSITRLVKDNTACSVKQAASCELDESICTVRPALERLDLVYLADEVYVGAVGDDAAFEAHGEQFANGVFAVFTVVEGAFVDVHADEAIGEGGVEVTRELHGVSQGLFAVVERVLDAVAQGVGGGEEGFGAKGAADGVSAEGKGKTGLFAPPLAEVEEFDEAIVGVGELAFVDDEAGVELACYDRGDDLVEGDGDGFDLGGEEFESEVGGGEGAGDRDARLLDFVERELAGCDDHGAVAFADAATAGHECVFVLKVGVGVEGDGGDVVEGLVDGAVIEGLYVGEGVGELVAGDSDLVGGEAVEHEGVVGVGAVGDADFLNCCTCGGHDASFGVRDACVMRSGEWLCAEFGCLRLVGRVRTCANV
jgi:hypothetical protein